MKRFSTIAFLLLSFSLMAQDVTLNVGGTLLTRYRYTSNEIPSNTFSIRTARVAFSGRVLDEFAYNLQFKMDGTTTSINGPRVLDASVEWQRFKAFKNPYGGNLDIDTDLGDKADAWYALMSAPLIPEVLHAKLRYDVYRDNGEWDRTYTAYDFGLDYCISYNLILSAFGTYINDRRLDPGRHNYFMFDFQMGLRF